MDQCYSNLINESPAVPTLTFISDDDMLTDADAFEANIVDMWRQRNPDNVIHHCFEESPHARHLQTHPEIYKKLFREYLTKVQALLEDADLIHQARREAGEELKDRVPSINPYRREIRTY